MKKSALRKYSVAFILALCPTLASAHGFEALGVLLFLFFVVAPIWFFVVIGVSKVLASLVDPFWKRCSKRGKSPGVAVLTVVLTLVLLPLSISGYFAMDRWSKQSNAAALDAREALRSAICKGDPAQWQTAISQHLKRSGGSVFEHARDCIVPKGDVDGFRALLRMQADFSGWRNGDIPPQAFCNWVQAAVQAEESKRKVFLTVFRAEKLPLHCRNNVQGLTMVWFELLFPLADRSDQARLVDWMRFLQGEGVSLDERSSNEGKTIIDIAAHRMLPELYRYLRSIDVKQNESTTNQLGTRQWWALKKADIMCADQATAASSTVAEMDMLVGALTAQDLNSEAVQGARFYEILLDDNQRRGRGTPECDQSRLLWVLSQNPIIDRPLKRDAISHWTKVDTRLFQALDSWSPMQAAYLAGFINGGSVTSVRRNPRHGASAMSWDLIEYLKSRGITIEDERR